MSSGSYRYKTITSTQHNLAQKTDIARVNAVSELLLLLFPVMIICAIAGYRRYRSLTLQRQINVLNRLLQLDCDKNLS
jgi:hypothetical protein